MSVLWSTKVQTPTSVSSLCTKQKVKSGIEQTTEAFLGGTVEDAHKQAEDLSEHHSQKDMKSLLRQ